jgi:hypothetical protein
MAEFNINPLIAQYLSGLGADLMKYGANTDKGFQMENVNAVTNQSIKSNNMMKLLQNALGPNKDSIKLSKGKVDMSFNEGSELYKNLIGADEGVGPSKVNESLRPITSEAQPNIPSSSMTDVLRGVDPTGIDPQSMLAVAKMMQDRQQFEQKTVGEVAEGLRKERTTEADIKYKEALTNAQTPTIPVKVGDKDILMTTSQYSSYVKDNKVAPEDQPHPIPVMGGVVSHRVWNSLPVSDKEYALATAQAKSIGDNKFMSKEEWLTTKPTERANFLREIIKNPALKDTALELAKAGAPTLGGVVEKQTALDEVKRQAEVKDPALRQKVVKQLMTNRINWADPPGMADYIKKNPTVSREATVKAFQDQMIRKEIDDMVRQAYPGARWTAGKGWTTANGKFIRGDI